MKELLLQLTTLKNDYKALQAKLRTLKTKAAQNKAYDAMRSVRREFNQLSYTIDWTKVDMSKMNLMAPSSGPWCLIEATDFRHEGSFISFKFPDNVRYVGEYSLIDDKCGFDNLAIISKQFVQSDEQLRESWYENTNNLDY